jgi:hypothetical protein
MAAVTLLRTRVARRILGLSFLSAALPIVLLTLISYRHLTQQLGEQTRLRLQQAAKITGLGILERLDLSTADLKIVTAALEAPAGSSVALDELSASIEGHFSSLVLARPGSLPVKIRGEMGEPAWPSEAEIDHLRSGHPLLRLDTGPDGTAVLLGRPFDERSMRRGIVWGRIDPSYIWDAGTDDTRPPRTSMCVLTELLEPLSCARPPVGLRPQVTLRPPGDQLTLEWTDGTEDFLAGYWSVSLADEYASPSWLIVLSESKTSVLAPLSDLKHTFLLVVCLAIGVAFLVSVIEIRNQLEPLASHQELDSPPHAAPAKP